MFVLQNVQINEKQRIFKIQKILLKKLSNTLGEKCRVQQGNEWM